MWKSIVALCVGAAFLCCIDAASAASLIYGIKSQAGSPSGEPQSGPPTHLFSFADSAPANFIDHGAITLQGSDIDADGLAVSATHGLRAFQIILASGYSSQLLSLTTSGVASVVGNTLTGHNIRGAMFDRSDRLWAVDSASDSLLLLDPSTSEVLNEVNITAGGSPLDINSGTDLTEMSDGGVVMANWSPVTSTQDFYFLDLLSGSATLAFQIHEEQPHEPFLFYHQGLAAGTGATASTLFAYDANGEDDIFAYTLPDQAGSLYIQNIIPEYNAGRGDLASTPVPLPQSAFLLGSALSVLGLLRGRHQISVYRIFQKRLLH